MRRVVILAARFAPKRIKKYVHCNPSVYRWSRRLFSLFMKLGGKTVEIDAGPMQGIRLAVGEHVSHAHISGTYELQTQLALDRLLRSEFICYDLGASIGYLSLLMARKARHVFAFEPARKAAEEIRKHAAVNGFENISIVLSPVSDCVRNVEFTLTDAAYGSRIVHSQQSKWPTMKLTTITLDDFSAAHPLPNLMKIDVEDEEAAVLQGARSILRQRKVAICCELHSERSAREVSQILAEYGYRITNLDGSPFHIAGPVIPGNLQVLSLPG